MWIATLDWKRLNNVITPFHATGLFLYPFKIPEKQIYTDVFRVHTNRPIARNGLVFNPFKRQFHKMVKHAQTIRQQIADEMFECVWQFCGIGA